MIDRLCGRISGPSFFQICARALDGTNEADDDCGSGQQVGLLSLGLRATFAHTFFLSSPWALPLFARIQINA